MSIPIRTQVSSNPTVADSNGEYAIEARNLSIFYG